MIQVRAPASDYTLMDLVDLFGPMPLHRIRQDPPPGTATEEDVLDTLNGGDVLPGFSLELRILFADPLKASAD